MHLLLNKSIKLNINILFYIIESFMMQILYILVNYKQTKSYTSIIIYKNATKSDLSKL